MRRSKWYGVRRLLVDLGVAAPPSYSVPAEYAEVRAALGFGDRQRLAAWWELALRAQIGAAVRNRAGSLGDIPVTVLTCSRDSPDASTEKERAYMRQHFEVWYPLQADLAAMSADSKHIVAERAGHYIHHRHPELVVESILDLVRRART
jgi:pimeloyl-ACP methyl ester carboxylesterase